MVVIPWNADLDGGDGGCMWPHTDNDSQRRRWHASYRSVAREAGIGAETLVRWREQIESRVSLARAWKADARPDAVITIAAIEQVSQSAWCRG